MKDECETFIFDNLSKVINDYEFRTLGTNAFLSLISANDRFPGNSELLFEGALLWIAHDHDARKDLIAPVRRLLDAHFKSFNILLMLTHIHTHPQILCIIRIHNVCPDFLDKRVRKANVVKEAIECRIIIEESQTHQLRQITQRNAHFYYRLMFFAVLFALLYIAVLCYSNII